MKADARTEYFKIKSCLVLWWFGPWLWVLQSIAVTDKDVMSSTQQDPRK